MRPVNMCPSALSVQIHGMHIPLCCVKEHYPCHFRARFKIVVALLGLILDTESRKFHGSGVLVSKI